MAIRSNILSVGPFSVTEEEWYPTLNGPNKFDLHVSWSPPKPEYLPEDYDLTDLSYRVLLHEVKDDDDGSRLDVLKADSGMITTTQVDFIGPFDTGKSYNIVIQSTLEGPTVRPMSFMIIEDVIKV